MTMHTRREFLDVTLKGATTAATTGLLAKAAFAADTDDTAREETSDGERSGHYRPPFAFGMGGVPLGNEFEYVTDEDAYATIEAAWNAGVRYFDMAPWYGLGLAERRYGSFLHNQQRTQYVVSTKVGKLLQASKTAKSKDYFPFSPSPNDVVFDYTASGVRRSIEDSLQRLGIDSIDIAFVHDLSSDNKLLPTPGRSSLKLLEKVRSPS
jgi:D-threo-aldose 1-dehydrogenase